MKRLILAGCVIALGLGSHSVMAQRRGGSGIPQGRDRNDLAPAYQVLLEFQRNALAVTNDAEWKVISPKLLRVLQKQMDA